jgi:hypothetical protein
MSGLGKHQIEFETEVPPVNHFSMLAGHFLSGWFCMQNVDF